MRKMIYDLLLLFLWLHSKKLQVWKYTANFIILQKMKKKIILQE